MKNKIRYFINRLKEQLWFRPLFICLISVLGALLAQQADGTALNNYVPSIDIESIKGLLNTISASMLVISIFAVASMLSAFSSASSTATPRSFKIIVTDDVSQNALSVFIGAFIFSIVGTIALNNGFYDKAGRFVLFLFTLLLFAVVILTFLRWVDRISRLGRLEHTIYQVEQVVAKSLSTYIKHPYLKGIPLTNKIVDGQSVYAHNIGYVQHVNMESLQQLAQENGLKIQLNCVPGKFVHKNFPIAQFSSKQMLNIDKIKTSINDSILIGSARLFDEDPRFGLISLTEIASRALSPGINDPGTAIQIIGSHERLFFLWNNANKNPTEQNNIYDRVEVTNISIDDFFDDAFRPISRDGADNIEVMLRLQKALSAIATINNSAIKQAALNYSEKAYKRAKLMMEFEDDLDTLKSHCLYNSIT